MTQDTAGDTSRPKRGMLHHANFLWRFILFARPFFSAQHKWRNRGWLILTMLLTAAQVAVQAGLNAWSARLYNAIEAKHLDVFLEQIVTFVLLLLASIAVFSVSLYVRRRLIFAWRVWLTKTTLSVWMAEGRHYELGLIAGGDHDNPDGRIADDIRVVTQQAVDLGQSLFYCILLLGTFVDVLWSLSGVVHVEIGGTTYDIPGSMVFIAFAYSAIGTSMALWAGLPLVGASNLVQTVEANFRFGLARAREYSESIALIRGDADERTHLQELLRGVRRGWESQTYGLVRLLVFTTAYSVLASPFPLLVAAPRYIWGLISLGTLMQMAQAFSQVTSALSFPVDNYSTIAQWRASVERVMALQNAMAGLQEKLGKNRVEVEQEGTSLQLAGVRVMRHDGVPLMQELTAAIAPGEHVRIEGDTQVCHKLILALAGLWPWGSGKVTLPDKANLFFASDRPYLPVGTLGEAVCYPMTLGVCRPDDINSALRRVGLGDWVGHLALTDDWDRVLSAAQRQRLSFARMLLHRPDWIFLAEATNALDAAAQRDMAEVLTTEFPSATVVAAGRAGMFEGYFQRVLQVKAETPPG